MEGAVVVGGDGVEVSGGKVVEMGAVGVEGGAVVAGGDGVEVSGGKVVEMGAVEVEGANTICANVVQSKALSNASF